MRSGGHAGKGACGGEFSGGEDAEGIDLLRGGKPDAPGNGGEADTGSPGFPAARGHQLGIADLVKGLEDASVGRQDKRGCADRSGPGAAPGFVDAGDLRIARIPKGLFVIKGRKKRTFQRPMPPLRGRCGDFGLW